MKIISVVGARPNFMKISPLIRAINRNNQMNGGKIEHLLVHTGQHYDLRMSETFFEALEIPKPDINLEIGSGTHAEQIGYTMIAFEKVLMRIKPDWVILVGDVNATLACSVAAKKLQIKVCHIEAGLRSGDLTMPEEINRLVTDRLSDLLLTPDQISSNNLFKEGTPKEKVFFVGNIMIDTLEINKERAARLSMEEIVKNNLVPYSRFRTCIPSNNKYIGITLHRPSNVDFADILIPLTKFFIDEVSKNYTLIWPIHPRTRKQLQSFGYWEKVINAPSVILLEPLGYYEMLRLNMGAKMMFTDSGGLQEECCILGTPCLTLRWNTERPVTLRENGGVSILVGNNTERIREEYYNILTLNKKPFRPELWDGHTADRILEILLMSEEVNNYHHESQLIGYSY